MKAGKLRHRISIQSRTSSKDDYGQPLENWSTLATVYASIEPLSGRELLTRSSEAALATHKIVIRYRSGITPANRMAFGARIFNIQYVANPREHNEFLELLCQEIVA